MNIAPDLLLLTLAQLRQRLGLLFGDPDAPSGPPRALHGMALREEDVRHWLGEDSCVEAGFALGSLWAPVLELAPCDGVLGRLCLLQERFRLSNFETEALLVALAPEIERGFERVFCYLNDHLSLRQPSAELLLRLLAPGNLRAQLQSLFASDARLLRHGLLEMINELPGSAPGLRVCDGVRRFLLDQGGIDALLSRVWCVEHYPAPAQELWDAAGDAEELAALIRSHREAPPPTLPLVLLLEGREGSGRRYAAEAACAQLGLGCIALDARGLWRLPEWQQALVAAFRDSVIAGAPILIHHLDAWSEEADRFTELRVQIERLCTELGWVVMLGTNDARPFSRWCKHARLLRFPFAEPSLTERADGWRMMLAAIPALADEFDMCEELAQTLATRFRIARGEMAETVFRALGSRHLPERAAGWRTLLLREASAVAAPRLRSLAQRIPTRHKLTEVVMAGEGRQLLADIVRRVRHRRQVLDDWGFESLSQRGHGLVALFHGASGTGKTLAAEAIATELGMDLYRVDLSGVVSKYIGETEKNLRAVFDEADASDAVLFFDEADALFGKRSEVKDAHDRYANIEINYLLQRIEGFSGIAILATNLRHHLDEAFLRRIHISVEFPMPKAGERLEIWRRSFPETAPLDEAADLGFLAQRFELAGGTIRNIAFCAAYLAAEEGESIRMAHLVAAAQREFSKTGRRVQAAEFGPHAIPQPQPVIGERHGVSTV